VSVSRIRGQSRIRSRIRGQREFGSGRGEFTLAPYPAGTHHAGRRRKRWAGGSGLRRGSWSLHRCIVACNDCNDATSRCNGRGGIATHLRALHGIARQGAPVQRCNDCNDPMTGRDTFPKDAGRHSPCSYFRSDLHRLPFFFLAGMGAGKTETAGTSGAMHFGWRARCAGCATNSNEFSWGKPGLRKNSLHSLHEGCLWVLQCNELFACQNGNPGPPLTRPKPSPTEAGKK
jgi:hypothetical protein